MKRFLWWTFTVVAAISAALLVVVVIGTAYLVWSDPGWLTILVSTPLKTVRPFIIYSVLPTAWLIVQAKRQRKRRVSGFEPIMPADRPEISS